MNVDTVLSKPPAALRVAADEQADLASGDQESEGNSKAKAVGVSIYVHESADSSEAMGQNSPEDGLSHHLAKQYLSVENPEEIDADSTDINQAVDNSELEANALNRKSKHKSKEGRKVYVTARKLSDWFNRHVAVPNNTDNHSGEAKVSHASKPSRKRSTNIPPDPSRFFLASSVAAKGEDSSEVHSSLNQSGGEKDQQVPIGSLTNSATPRLAANWKPTVTNERRDAASPFASTKPTVNDADDCDIVAYIVGENDTLERVAARFDTTPSVIMRLNRLNTRLIFPGQKIRVPKRSREEKSSERSLSVGASPSAVVDTSSMSTTPSFGVNAGDTSAPTAGNEPEDSTTYDVERFVRLVAKRVVRDNETSNILVNGTFLVTPNMIMFDPNVSDPHVLEHGTQRFSVLAPLDTVRSVSAYPDQPVGYQPPVTSINSTIGTGVDTPALNATAESISASETSPANDLSSEKQKDVVDVSVHGGEVSLNNGASIDQTEGNASTEQQAERASNLAKTSKGDSHSRSKSLDKGLTALQGYLINDQTIQREPPAVIAQAPTPRRKRSSVVRNEVRTNDLVVSTKKHSVAIYYQNAVGVVDANQLLSNTDELLRAATSRTTSDAQPMQCLCIIAATASCYSSNKKSKQLESPESSVCYEEDVEYWFAVPKAHVEDLRSFCSSWLRKAQRYGKKYSAVNISTNAANNEVLTGTSAVTGSVNLSVSASFEGRTNSNSNSISEFNERPEPEIDTNTNTNSVTDGSHSSIINTTKSHLSTILHCEVVKLWEIQNLNAQARHASCAGATSKLVTSNSASALLVALAVPLTAVGPAEPATSADLKSEAEPQRQVSEEQHSLNHITTIELVCPSCIFKSEHLKSLSSHIPARAQGYSWMLTYSTELHGFSLSTLYRRQAESSRVVKPCLLVLIDTLGSVFGAFCSDQLLPSDYFFGTGECFVFTFVPEFRVHHWTGENNYFIKCSSQFLAIGCSRGQNALWLDEQLNRGRTQDCETFNSLPLSESNQDFLVRHLEIWTIEDED